VPQPLRHRVPIRKHLVLNEKVKQSHYRP
jgi:hypothetical protein